MQSCWHWNQTAWVTNEGRLRWFECVECKDDTDWVHCHTTVELVSGIAIFVLKRDVKLQLTNDSGRKTS